MNIDTSKQIPTPDLSSYRASDYSPGSGFFRRNLWRVVNIFIFMSPLLPFYAPKRLLLRMFGARIGHGVVIKPRVNIKHPWRLSIGHNSWLGEGVWLDNLSDIVIGDNVCLSQGSLLITGNHDYKDVSFSLITRPINIEDGAWIGAGVIVCPGVNVARNTVVTVGSVLTKNTDANGIYTGNPAQKIRTRSLEPARDPI